MLRPRTIRRFKNYMDVLYELVKSTLLTCDCADYVVDRPSEQRKNAGPLSKRVNLRSVWQWRH
jgi:arsenic resistance protein ArsH